MTSLICWLSAESPVVIVSASRACLRPRLRLRSGLKSKRLTCWMTSSTVNGSSASCGRHADVNAVLSMSRNSARAGDSSSASWKSDSCAKYSSERRRVRRPLRGLPPSSSRTTRFQPASSFSREYGAAGSPPIVAYEVVV
ncbi:MAG: hypothetical protein H0W96_10580, partial [Solirubrobacterales bacterium]|nr:hypothetical protein [Solirubrobacterales bacterium]